MICRFHMCLAVADRTVRFPSTPRVLYTEGDDVLVVDEEWRDRSYCSPHADFVLADKKTFPLAREITTRRT